MMDCSKRNKSDENRSFRKKNTILAMLAKFVDFDFNSGDYQQFLIVYLLTS